MAATSAMCKYQVKDLHAMKFTVSTLIVCAVGNAVVPLQKVIEMVNGTFRKENKSKT